MAPDMPPGAGGFFPSFFGDLLRLLKTDAPFPFELALQLADSIAQQGGSKAAEPLERIRLEEFGRIAELQVADVTGMSTTSGGRSIEIVPLSRADWARTNLLAWRSALESLALELRPKPEDVLVPPTDDEDEAAEDLGAFIAQWSGAVAPAMIAMQFGSLVGHLATRTLGQYELLLPRADDSTLTVVPENVAAFAEDWSLAKDDVSFYLTVRDVALHTIVTRPHVRSRLLQLILEHARGFRPDPHALENLLGDASASGPRELAEMSQLLGNPSALGAMSDSEEQRRVRAELAALSAAIGGYGEWVTRSVADRSIGASNPIAEALRRRRIERGEDERAADALFGLALDQQSLDRGEDFVRGVIARDGEVELSTLFVVQENLPTPAEIDAPGLWLERIRLDRSPHESD